MTGIERIGFLNPWLHPLAVESAKAETLKMAGQASEKADQVRKTAADREIVLDSKKVKPVEGISAGKIINILL